MSEHEGFCVPLVEAMYYGIPVLAYASTGVPFTMDDAGVLFRHKDHSVVAEMAHEVVVNGVLRTRLLEKQRTRVAAFAPDRVRALFRKCIDSIGVG